MDKKITYLLTISLILIILTLSACNMPNQTAPTTQPDTGMINTIAAQTIQAQLTQVVATSQATQPQPTTAPPQPTDTLPPTAAPTNTNPPPTREPSQPTNSPQPSATITTVPCNRASFVKDVTIEDNTKMTPGETFKKTWRLKNTGSCTWTSGYDLVFDHGDSMGSPAAVQLTSGTVKPGQEVDVSVDLTAPDDPGTYQGFYKLRSTDDIIFGMGDKDKAFWVKIVVPGETGLLFDFIARASDADWGSGTGGVNFDGPGDISLTFGGPDSNHNGFAMIRDGIKLENGSTSGKLLETHPKWENDGYIVGLFPKYTVGAGDYIKGRIGFIANSDGSCGVGNAYFAIDYIIGDDVSTHTRLNHWNETCDGTLTQITINLNSLKGKKVRFYLVVKANGSSSQDWAIWRSLGVFRD
ncbi:MAG TPA: hypothetical protein G4N95_00550 [Anaerolineae bacterium]|nr:hypothetical protein [Anaerolineae bacterium]